MIGTVKVVPLFCHCVASGHSDNVRLMSRSIRHGRWRRAAIVVTAIFALLFHGSFAIACDVHDLGHAEAAVSGDAHAVADGHDETAGLSLVATDERDNEGSEGNWHDLFATVHGLLQVFGGVALVSVDSVRLPAIGLPSPVHDRVPTTPSGPLLRPPIVV